MKEEIKEEVKGNENTAKTTAETKPTKRTKAAQQQEEKMIYLGPTIRGIAMKGTVYVGGIPKIFEDAIKAYPVIKELLVPISQIVEANRMLSDPNSAISTFYKLIGRWEGGTK